MNIDELLARIEINDVLARYCRAVDRGDIELLSSVYHEGGTDKHGGFDGTGEDFAPYIIEKMDGAGQIGQHHITNILIELEGDTANVESYFIAFQPYANEAGESHLAHVGGRYLDRFAFRDGRWAITERRVIMDWSRASIEGNEWPGMPNYPRGARRESDESDGFFSHIS